MSRARLLPTFLAIACGDVASIVDSRFTDSYTAGLERTDADVLFVVDDSASMSEEQDRLGADVGAMLDVLGEARDDVRFGVITTDVGSEEAGVLRGGVLVAADPLAEALGAALRVGTDGSREEAGTEAVDLALDGRNAGFPNPDGRLEILFFSDEDDASEVDPDAWLDALLARFPSRLRVHGVVGDLPGGCFSPDGAADAGARYVQLIERTGGYQESICAPDYAGLMQRLGLDLSGVQDTFPLSRLPRPDTIEVDVDGSPVDSDPLVGWTYEPAPNAIVFRGPSVPARDALVEIRYERLVGSSRPDADEGDLPAGP